MSFILISLFNTRLCSHLIPFFCFCFCKINLYISTCELVFISHFRIKCDQNAGTGLMMQISVQLCSLNVFGSFHHLFQDG